MDDALAHKPELEAELAREEEDYASNETLDESKEPGGDENPATGKLIAEEEVVLGGVSYTASKPMLMSRVYSTILMSVSSM